jgi:lipopolysaccharide/colanic/teichoic acid biosynthesis glycosyltransferase
LAGKKSKKAVFFYMVCYAGAVFAKENDPRVTRLGRLLRATAFDELLQVISILRGDMSFVGPRAERLELMEKFSNEVPNFSQRLMVRPGLTGMAQVYGKYDSSPVFQEFDTLSLKLDNLINKRRMKEGN